MNLGNVPPPNDALTRIALVIPVFNDWASLAKLLDAIDIQPSLERTVFDIIIVNDYSRIDVDIDFRQKHFHRIQHVDIVNLICNLGHQRAIAVGLVAARDLEGVHAIIVMDSDGEDQASDIPRLIAEARNEVGKIICARRAQRSESVAFKVLYVLYRIIFRWLTGANIDFGNFCYIPRSALNGIAHLPSTWNHLAATLVRSQFPLSRIDTKRGQRYAGKTSMNLSTLVVHGLSAISVYTDIVLVRGMIGLFGVSLLTVIGIVIVTFVKLFSDVAIPGWASNVVGSLTIVLLQSLIFAGISAFVLLNSRSAKPVIPAIDAPQFIASRTSYDLIVNRSDDGV
jgi:polyisoprenyl-phosphate glycosyltransferase